MADIYLKVGVDKDYSDFQTGINNLVSEINKTPPKIKISFDTKQAIKDLREQLASINKSLDIGNTNTQIQAYSKNLSNVGNTAKTAAKGVEELIKTTQKYSNSNDTPYITSQTYLNTLNNTLRTETQVRDEVGNIKEELATITNSYKTQEQLSNELYNKENKRVEVNKKIATEIDKITSKQRAVAKVGGEDTTYYKQLESYKTKLSDLQSQYKKTGDYNSFTIALKEVQAQYAKTKTAADNYIASKKREIQESAKTVAQENAKVSSTKKYNSILAQCESALRNYTSAQSSSNASSRTAYNDIKSATSSLKSQYSQLQAGKISEKQFGQAVENTNNILRSGTNIIKSNGDATKTFLDRVGGLASKFTSWLTISQVIMYAVRAVRNMITESINLDTAMTELKKVTDETDETYSEFLDNAAERAKKLGVTLSDVVSASADFARLGYNIGDASTLADVATIYKNVGDGIESIDEASQSIIATMQAFGLGAEDAMSIVDKFNEVGNRYAISAKGVGDALLRSAAAMKAAGNTLDETIALTAEANTVVFLCHIFIVI